MIKQSIIISYKESDDDRRTNLQRILLYLLKLLDKETEIVLVEQGDVSKIDWLDKNEQINHIFLKNSGIFNKGWGYNVGVKNSKSNRLIFNDIDVFLPPEIYLKGLELLEKCDVVDPYNKIYFLDKLNSEKFISNGYDFVHVDPSSSYYLPNVISGGIFMMKKEKFLSLKGFDEECYGYGHEDDIFDAKIRILGISAIRMIATAIHIHHIVIKDNEYYSRQMFNESLFNRYIRMSPAKLQERINTTKSFGVPIK
jgi:predicted glycosyltransferase involved in capsule biosynthesis